MILARRRTLGDAVLQYAVMMAIGSFVLQDYLCSQETKALTGGIPMFYNGSVEHVLPPLAHRVMKNNAQSVQTKNP